MTYWEATTLRRIVAIQTCCLDWLWLLSSFKQLGVCVINTFSFFFFSNLVIPSPLFELTVFVGALTANQTSSILSIAHDLSGEITDPETAVQLSQLLSNVAAISPTSVGNPSYMGSLTKVANSSQNSVDSRFVRWKKGRGWRGDCKGVQKLIFCFIECSGSNFTRIWCRNQRHWPYGVVRYPLFQQNHHGPRFGLPFREHRDGVWWSFDDFLQKCQNASWARYDTHYF